MAYTMISHCISCDSCRIQCPTNAISLIENRYSIDPVACNNCHGYHPAPLCVEACPTLNPVPLNLAKKPKKGRHKLSNEIMLTSPELFSDGNNSPIASSIIIWEACNILAQRESLPWTTDADGKLFYYRSIKKELGFIHFRITNYLERDEPPTTLAAEEALNAIQKIDIRAACMHLIYAAHATGLARPWEEEFAIDDKQIEAYLGLDRRKDLSKSSKLSLIKYLAQQPSQITAFINWPQQGKVKAFTVEESRIWHITSIDQHFQEDREGNKYVAGLTFKIKAGAWAEFFLNKEGYKDKIAFYQYGILPQFLLKAIMSIWQQHEGAARMMLWLLFKTKLGIEQPITVATLMKVAYGERKVAQAYTNKNERKKRIRVFESDLEVLNSYGFKALFDPISYPLKVQPLWAKLSDVPEDSDEALTFWIDDGGKEMRLTDPAPRGKWLMLMKARILRFELPDKWEKLLTEFENKKQQIVKTRQKYRTQTKLTSSQIVEARKRKGLSQRSLAAMVNKSQSWVRDIENGRIKLKLEEQERLKKVLELSV